MRKLLNTIYVTNEQMYLMLIMKILSARQKEKLNFGFLLKMWKILCVLVILMFAGVDGKCVKKLIPINFMSPQVGNFWQKVYWRDKGNVFLRVEQIDCFQSMRIAAGTKYDGSKIQ